MANGGKVAADYRSASIAGGIAGVVGWVVLLVAFMLAPTPPTLGASASDITKYFSEHHTAVLFSSFLYGAAAFPFALWAGALAAKLRQAEGEAAWLYLTFLSGVIVTIAVNVCASFVSMALSGRGWAMGDANAQMLADITNYAYIFTGFGTAVFVAAASAVMIRSGAIAPWLGQAGLIVAVIQVVSLTTAFFSDGIMVGGGSVFIAGFMILGLWLLAVSIGMIARARIM
jgi:hypothetical protein